MGLREERTDFEISDQINDYIIEKDSWLIPYYIQIIVDELFDFFIETEQKPTERTIDEVIDKIIRDRYKY